MPYYKKKTYRKRKVGPWGKRARIYGRAGSQLVKDVMLLKSVINTEYKRVDTTYNAVASATPVITLLNGSIQGTDFDERVGRTIRFKSFDIKGFLTPGSTSGNFRAWLVIDNTPNSTLPVIGDIIEQTAGPGDYSIGHRNLNNRKRFGILKEWCIPFGGGNAYAGMTNYCLDYYMKLDFKTEYDASNAGDISDIKSNSLYFVHTSDQPAVSGPLLKYYVRLRAVDN